MASGWRQWSPTAIDCSDARDALVAGVQQASRRGLTSVLTRPPSVPRARHPADLLVQLQIASAVRRGEWTGSFPPAVAAAHAEALDVQIRILRLRRAVLTRGSRRGSP